MIDKPIHPNEQIKAIHFPKAGIDLLQAFSRQKPRPVMDGVYARTCPAGNNVRGIEPISNRSRGGSRSGLEKFIAAQVSGREFIVQCLDVVVTVSVSAET